MPVKTKSSGPSNASIMIIGEAPGHDEEVRGVPFVGESGQELTKILHEAGIVRSECFLTNVCKYRPPGNDIASFFLDKALEQPNELVKEGIVELFQEIESVKPRLIIALGNTPLWALRKHRVITKWRGSMLMYGDAMLMPSLHPAYIMRDWSMRAMVVSDLKRAAKYIDSGWPKPQWDFRLRPSFQTTIDTLRELLALAAKGPLRLSSDLETRHNHIACHGIAWSRTEAISIPTLCTERPDGYWQLDEQVAIWQLERELMTHENVEVIGQNYLYDVQYFARRLGYIPRVRHDTRIRQHVAWAGMPATLDFMSSIYCEHHTYWKDEGKEWTRGMPEEQLWSYNCQDACRTYEINSVLEGIIEQLGLTQQYAWQMQVWYGCLEMMLRGVAVDRQQRGILGLQMMQALQTREREIEQMLKAPLNVRSPKQMMELFYGVLKCKVVRDKKTKKPTTNDEALRTFMEREPLLTPLIKRIQDIRSLGVINSNAVQAPLDADGRIRCLFDPTAETYRWKSSKNAFGTGTNLQNWTKGNEEEEEREEGKADLPNVRKLLVPDPGYELASIDLSGADAQAVAWEANDSDLKAAFRAKVKIHAHNAKSMFRGKVTTGFEQPYYDLCRTGVHLVNYCGTAPTLAAAMKFSVYEAQSFMREWFQLHPGILDWHKRVEDQLQRTRQVTNKFGYRRFYFDRIEGILKEAVAWIGQSNTACVCNQALIRLRAQPEMMCDLRIEMLLQVHDELVFQYPIAHREEVLRLVNPIVHVTVPYDDPLVIPWGLKVSTKSWGDCEKREWPAG